MRGELVLAKYSQYWYASRTHLDDIAQSFKIGLVRGKLGDAHS